MAEFTRPLRLVSPHMKGQAVKDAQWLLAGHSRFDGLATYKDGKIDGVYGPVTAHAVSRAKFWIGYPAASCDQVFGQTLYEYLRPQHWRPLPDAYRVRRAQRLAAAAKTPGEKALELALTFVGYQAGPHNDNIFGRWFGWNYVAWCAIFESYCFGHTGHPQFRETYVPRMYDDARNGRGGLSLVRTPKPGDLALYSWPRDPLAHTAFVREPPVGGSFVDCGGNTGHTNYGNGGEVLSQKMSVASVAAWVRVA